MPQLSKKQLYYGIATGVLLVCLLASTLLKDHKIKETAEDTPLVRTQIVGISDANQKFTYSGEVRGRHESQLAFQVAGKIIKRNVDLGSTVKPGDILMVIDPKDIQQSVNMRSAQVTAAESQLQLARDNLNRYRQLYEQNAVSMAEYDRYRNAYETAQAAVQQASAQYAEGTNQLSYSNLCADSYGVIAGIDAEAGQVVTAGQKIMTLVEDGEREVEINVPENRLAELRIAQQVKVKFWALPNLVVDGTVREVAPMADKVSRTFKVRISLIAPPPDLKLGMTATVTIANSSDQAAAFIPLSSIYQTGNTPQVWVVNDNVVSLRPIQIGSFRDNCVQVLSGLQPGDVIVTAGVHKLLEGQKVRITGDVL